MNKESNSVKNISTLIVGSILVMLSLIILLVTSWYTMGNIVKVGILCLFEVFFLGLSKLLKDKYKLKGFGDALYYIGIAYLPILLLLISMLGLFGDYLSYDGEGKYIYLSLAALGSSTVYYLVGKKQNVDLMLYISILFQIITVIYTGCLFEFDYLKINILLLLYNAILLFVNNNKKINYMSITLLIILVIETIAYHNYSWSCIISWLLLFMNFVIAKYKNNNVIYDYCINITLYRTLYLLIFNKFAINIELISCHLLMMLAIVLVVVIINSFVKDDKFIQSSRVISSSASLVLYSVYSGLPVYYLDLFMCLLLAYNYELSKNNIYKYILYLFIMVLLIDLSSLFIGINIIKRIIPAIVTMIILIYNLFKDNEIKIIDKVMLNILEVISLVALTFHENIYLSIIAIILVGISILFNYKKQINRYYDLIPLLLLICCLNGLEVYTQAILLIIVTIATYYLSYKDKTQSYKISSFIYTFYLGNLIANELAIKSLLYLLVILWSYVNVISTDKLSIKNIFKTILVIFSTLLYYEVWYQFNLGAYTFIFLSGFVFAGLYLIKDIIAKIDIVERKDLNIIEIMLFGLVYFFALTMYTSAYDGLLFTIYILIFTMVGYYIKDEAMFMVSLIALLINALDLTREFWLAIPWWIYLLLIGGILILTAVINEINQTRKDDKITIKNIVKKIKNNFNK